MISSSRPEPSSNRVTSSPVRVAWRTLPPEPLISAAPSRPSTSPKQRRSRSRPIGYASMARRGRRSVTSCRGPSERVAKLVCVVIRPHPPLRGRTFRARPKTKVLGRVRAPRGNLPQRLELVLGGPNLIEQVEQRAPHRAGEESLEAREVSRVARVERPEVSRPISRQDVHGRPVVFQEVKVQEESTDPAVAVAERVDRLELEVHPRSEREHPDALYVLLRIRLLPFAHEGDDLLHPRRDMPDAGNANIHLPPPTRIRLDASEHGVMEVEDR